MEAGLISPIFLIFLLAIFEFGGAFLAYLAVGNTVNQTGRAATIFGSNGMADYQIVQAAKKSSSVLRQNDIQYIVIWHATNSRSEITADAPLCAGGASSFGSGSPNWTNACNVYTPAQFSLTTAAYGCTAAAPDRYWCPTDRKSAATGPKSSDYVGVYIKYRHRMATGLFGTSYTFDDLKVSRIEPTTLT